MTGRSNLSHCPSVTVGVPTTNRPEYLRDCLEALVTQTYPNIRIVIIAGKCNSDTYSVIDEYCQCHPSVSVVSVGRASLDNMDIIPLLSISDYFAIAHDDDVPLITWIESLVSILHSSDDIALVSCTLRLIDGDSRPVTTQISSDHSGIQRIEPGQFVAQYLNDDITLSCPTVLYSSARLINHPLGMNFRYLGPAADVLYWDTVNETNTIAILHEQHYVYRVHSSESQLKLNEMHLKLFPELAMRLYFRKQWSLIPLALIKYVDYHRAAYPSQMGRLWRVCIRLVAYSIGLLSRFPLVRANEK